MSRDRRAAARPSGTVDEALECLRERRAAGASHGLSTSNLSVEESLLLSGAGYELRQLVSGSAAYHLSLRASRGPGWWRTGEVTQLTEALYTSRRRAVDRLASAAGDVGATGVAGVRLEVSFSGSELARFIALGTAISGPAAERPRAGDPPGAGVVLGVAGGSKAAVEPPVGAFTSSLSGRELYLLERAGYRPSGIVMGCCVYRVGRRSPTSWVATLTRSAEMGAYTEALYRARELAMERMQTEAVASGGEGIVGVDLLEESHVWGARVIELLAIGTAIVATGSSRLPLSPRLATELAEESHGMDARALRAARERPRRLFRLPRGLTPDKTAGWADAGLEVADWL
ncbi:MAG: heavy metal-binding domain-containing protein [Acidimicrobiales bacterium]